MDVMMKFYLGTHMPSWLGHVDVPLFVSRRRLVAYRRLGRHKPGYAIDSGGFSELSLHGRWTITVAQFIRECRTWIRMIGKPDFIASMDWMCEPFILEKTGKTLSEHQALTVESYLQLKELAPDLPWLPVLQGFTLDDYLVCLRLYERNGVNLLSCPQVGLGSICRRQGTKEAVEIIRHLAGIRLKLHGFGFKKTGLEKCSKLLKSADSMAWSYAGRRKPLAGCRHAGNCANCLAYALKWLGELHDSLQDP
jgi:hypothetical protein